VSINAESARYKVIGDKEGHIPADWPEEWATTKLRQHTEEGDRLYHEAADALTPVLGRQRAKESVRYFRGYNSTIDCDITFNWRSFFHFYQLRSAPGAGAQKEIRDLASEMLQHIKELPGNPYQHTLAAFNL